MRSLISCLVLSLSLGLSTAVCALEKVGVIDYQVMAKEVPFQNILANKMKSTLEADQTKLKESNKKSQDLQAAFDAKEKENKWTETEKDAAKKEIDDMRKQLGDMQSSLRTKAMANQQNLQKELQNDLQTMAKKIAQEKGLARVFRADSLIWDENAVDITEPLVDELNKKYQVTKEMKMQHQNMGLNMPQRPGSRF